MIQKTQGDQRGLIEEINTTIRAQEGRITAARRKQPGEKEDTGGMAAGEKMEQTKKNEAKSEKEERKSQ